MSWSDEFDGPAGTPPDPAHWEHEPGSGGNDELQRYTGERANAALDGHGCLAITARPDLTSARLRTKGRFKFTYGRIETRLRVPRGA